MKFIYKKYRVLFAVILFSSIGAVIKGMSMKNPDSISTYTVPMCYLGNAYETIPFPVSTSQDKKYYLGSMLGLKIESIKVDGSPLLAVEKDVDLDDVDMRVGHFESGVYVYRMNINELFFARDFRDGDFEIDRYELPVEYRTIEIIYALRSIDGELGAPVRIMLQGEK